MAYMRGCFYVYPSLTCCGWADRHLRQGGGLEGGDGERRLSGVAALHVVPIIERLPGEDGDRGSDSGAMSCTSVWQVRTVQLSRRRSRRLRRRCERAGVRSRSCMSADISVIWPRWTEIRWPCVSTPREQMCPQRCHTLNTLVSRSN